MQQLGDRPGRAVVVTQPDRQVHSRHAGRVGEEQAAPGRRLAFARVADETRLATGLDQGFVELYRRPAQTTVPAPGERPAVLAMVAPHVHEQRTVLQLDHLTFVGVLSDSAADPPGPTVIVAVDDMGIDLV